MPNPKPKILIQTKTRMALASKKLADNTVYAHEEEPIHMPLTLRRRFVSYHSATVSWVSSASIEFLAISTSQFRLKTSSRAEQSLCPPF